MQIRVENDPSYRAYVDQQLAGKVYFSYPPHAPAGRTALTGCAFCHLTRGPPFWELSHFIGIGYIALGRAFVYISMLYDSFCHGLKKGALTSASGGRTLCSFMLDQSCLLHLQQRQDG